MPLTDNDIALALAPAGLIFIERVAEPPDDPLPEGRGPANCLDEHGRFDSERINVFDADMPERVDADWWQMATSYGLLDQNREFLLSVDYTDYADPEVDVADAEPAWVRVRLGEDWKLAASGIGQLMRWSFGDEDDAPRAPEFAMLSSDGQMILNTTVWGDATVSTIVVRPDRVQR